MGELDTPCALYSLCPAGAHDNHGMGHKFLRHIERTKGLLYIIDIAGFRLSEKACFSFALDCTQRMLISNVSVRHWREGKGGFGWPQAW